MLVTDLFLLLNGIYNVEYIGIYILHQVMCHSNHFAIRVLPGCHQLVIIIYACHVTDTNTAQSPSSKGVCRHTLYRFVSEAWSQIGWCGDIHKEDECWLANFLPRRPLLPQFAHLAVRYHAHVTRIIFLLHTFNFPWLKIGHTHLLYLQVSLYV